MADEKKPEVKSPAPEKDPFVDIMIVLIAFFVGLYLLNQVFRFVSGIFSGEISDNPLVNQAKDLYDTLIHVLHYAQIFIVVFSAAGVAFIVYLFRGLNSLRINEKKLLYPETVSKASAINPHWERILVLIESLNENDWRLAIIEADIMLSGILDRLGLPGNDMGDKLRAVEKSDFTTVDEAWEAHKIRNQIAHEGGSFIMTQRDVRRVIELYRRVFEEFQII